MNITLKKAQILAAALLEAAKLPPTSIKVSMYSDAGIGDLVSNASVAFDAGVVRHSRFISAGYAIRQQIAVANIASNIAQQLGHKASLERMLRDLNGLVTRDTPLDVDAATKQREASRTSDSYGRTPSLEVVFVTKAELEPLISQIQRQLRETTEQIVEKNFSTRITLPDDVVAVLRDADLI